MADRQTFKCKKFECFLTSLLSCNCINMYFWPSTWGSFSCLLGMDGHKCYLNNDACELHGFVHVWYGLVHQLLEKAFNIY